MDLGICGRTGNESKGPLYTRKAGKGEEGAVLCKASIPRHTSKVQVLRVGHVDRGTEVPPGLERVWEQDSSMAPSLRMWSPFHVGLMNQSEEKKKILGNF